MHWWCKAGQASAGRRLYWPGADFDLRPFAFERLQIIKGSASPCRKVRYQVGRREGVS